MIQLIQAYYRHDARLSTVNRQVRDMPKGDAGNKASEQVEYALAYLKSGRLFLGDPEPRLGIVRQRLHESRVCANRAARLARGVQS